MPKLIAIGLLTKDPALWGEHIKECLEFCEEYLVFAFGGCEDSAIIARDHGADVLDVPLGYLEASDSGDGLTALYQEALKRGAAAVYMADPTDKLIGDPRIAMDMIVDMDVDVIKSRMFKARVTEQDDGRKVFDHEHFEPEYNYKVTFCKCRRGRLFWAMYPFWPYGALSCSEYGLVKSYALAHSKDAYRVLTMSADESVEKLEDIEAKVIDWVAHDMKSSAGNPLITEEEFCEKGVPYE